MAILDNAHPIMGVATSNLVGVAAKIFARKQSSTPLYRFLDTPLRSHARTIMTVGCRFIIAISGFYHSSEGYWYSAANDL
jgi:hypothetical protein